MKTVLCATVALLVMGAGLRAQPAPQEKLDFIADGVQFAGDSLRSIWEFQYSFPDTALTYIPAGNLYEGSMYVRLTLASTFGDTLAQEWISASSSVTSRFSHRSYLTGIRRFLAKPGLYHASLMAHDINNPTVKLESTFDVTIRDFTKAPGLSDIMFCMVPPPGTPVDSSFLRNGYTTMPNPRHESIGAEPSIDIYVEMYNTRMLGHENLTMQLQVLDNVRTEVLTQYVPVGTSAKALGTMYKVPIDIIPSGVYYLKTSLMTPGKDSTLAVAEDRFFILNPQIPPEARVMMTEDEEFMASEWSVTTGSALKLELDLARVLATNAERDVMNDCQDDRCRQRFLFRYWKSRDPNPETHQNERLNDFRAMYKRAQAFYSNPAFPQGWRSDRGQTLLRYGVPNQIEQYNQTMEAKPYEVWFYSNIQGGVYFYFVDVRLTQSHVLVHSTKNGEVRNEKWYEQFAKALNLNPNPESQLRPSTK